MIRISKNIYLLAGICLIAGTLIGYLISPSAHQPISQSNHEQISTSNHQHTNTAEIWTCSMHPNIRQSGPGQCPLCGMDLILAGSSPSSPEANPYVHEMSPEAAALANIHTSRVTRHSASKELLLTGKVQADERQRASVTARFPGRIETLFVNYTGQVVQQGQRLASVYSPELLTAQKELMEAASSKAVYPELYAAAREKLRLWKLDEAQIHQMESSGKPAVSFDVLADRSGIVIQRNVSVGDYVTTGSALFEVADLSKVWIMLDAYESDLPLLKVGQEVKIKVAAMPGQEFGAKITFIDPLIDPDTRTAAVRAEIPNPKMMLKPEMLVTAKVQSPQAESLSIPRTALLWSGRRSLVYVKVPDTEVPAYEMREITIGPLSGDVYLVEAGLDAGEEIVTHGVFAVDASAQLAGNYSMMTRPEPRNNEVPDIFREQITAVAEAYFELKNALVESDKDKAIAAATRVKAALVQVERQELTEKRWRDWTALSQEMERAVDTMPTAETLEAVRFHFKTLSDAVITATESYGLSKKVYKHFCPMAFNNQGAFWLSESETIRNPYFGDAMLGCGEVARTYPGRIQH